MASSNPSHQTDGSLNQTLARSRQTRWLLIGEVDHPEFAWGPLASQLAETLVLPWDKFELFDQWLVPLRESQSPTAIFIWTPRPGTLSQESLDRCSSLFPMAGIVQIVGAWCDGELRTGRPVQGVERVRWCDWQSLSSESLLQRRWAPRTWTPIEHLLTQATARRRSLEQNFYSAADLASSDQSERRPQARTANDARWCVIEADDRETFEALQDLVDLTQLKACWVRGSMVHGAPASGLGGEQIVGWIRDESGTRSEVTNDLVIAQATRDLLCLINYPRSQDLIAPNTNDQCSQNEPLSSEAGALAAVSDLMQSPLRRTVLSKPYSIDRVLQWLDQVLGSEKQSPRNDDSRAVRA